jgi:molybdenum cofactor cytidylyltransferase
MISAVILAAGLSTRLGRPKQLLRLGNKAVLEYVIDNVSQVRVGEIILVLGAHRQEIEQVISDRPVRCVFNPQYATGQGSSVAAGAAAVSPESRGILFLAGDQPLIPPEFIDRVITVFQETDALIIRPETGLPAIFDISLREELKQLTGDTGGRQLMAKYRRQVVVVPGCPGLASLDIDTEEDYRLLQAYWKDTQGFPTDGCPL